MLRSFPQFPRSTHSTPGTKSPLLATLNRFAFYDSGYGSPSINLGTVSVIAKRNT